MTVFDQMISRYDIRTENERRNAIHEVMQEIALAGLYRSGFFEKAAFYGGTCLRIFHSLSRFSEDMDFSLLANNDSFKLEEYFPAIVKEFKSFGRDVIIEKKEKRSSGNIESAFLKDDTEIYNLSFRTERTIKVKIEVDTNPPPEFLTEQKLLLQPFSFMTRCFVLPDMFAGKMHALLFRNWKSRVKGRDWYDFEWYIRSQIPLGFNHLQVRCEQINGIEMNKEVFINQLKNRLSSTDIELVKRDVTPFIRDKKELEIWSNNYFLQLADMIKYV
ncbi:MAG: nucleotidyl transferase AbiEii/AbiGii toxin family protein [Bacteroidales bacterium]